MRKAAMEARSSVFSVYWICVGVFVITTGNDSTETFDALSSTLGDDDVECEESVPTPKKMKTASGMFVITSTT